MDKEEQPGWGKGRSDQALNPKAWAFWVARTEGIGARPVSEMDISLDRAKEKEEDGE